MRLLIAAVCARPYVRAALAAGHQVIAADAFADADTQALAARALLLPYTEGGFCPDAVRQRLLPALRNVDAFLYGSGLETHPDLLDEIAQQATLLGNDAATLRRTKAPGDFFALLSHLAIPCPDTTLAAPAKPRGWLQKRIGGSGGTHIRAAETAAFADPSSYYQRAESGQPYSLLFLATRGAAQAVGFNQLLVSPHEDMPYRYAGVASGAALPAPVKQKVLTAAGKLAGALGLRGLNSLDFLVREESFLVLEINPRLSASFALYDAAHRGARLFEAHVEACCGRPTTPIAEQPPQAHLVYYAPRAITIPAHLPWPDWVADIPETGAVIAAHQPLCSVMAQAESATAAITLARQRMAALTQRLFSTHSESQHHEREHTRIRPLA